MSPRLAEILAGSYAPGIYRWGSRRNPARIIGDAQDANWRCFWLDGHTIDDKASFLAACAQAMSFPGYAGRNWDAFEECLNDLSWAPAAGYLVLFDQAAHFAEAAPAEWAIVSAIFIGAAGQWQAAGIPFLVLIRGPQAPFRELPKL